jgi:hypothetical protein
MWYTEVAWPPAITGLVLAVVVVAVWYQNQKAALLVVAALCVVVGFAAFVVDGLVVTDREVIHDRIVDLVRDFQARDKDKFLAHFSPQADVLRGLAKLALAKGELDKDAVLRDISVTPQAGNSRATSRFRVNGSVTWDTIRSPNMPSRWEVGWRKEAGEWKILEVTRLNPLKDEPMEIFQKAVN